MLGTVCWRDRGTREIADWRDIKRSIDLVVISILVWVWRDHVFGLLLGFGMLFPNTRLQLLFPPVPIKARYFVLGYGAIELLMALQNNPGDNVAHFAHLGGMIFGYLLLKKWQKDREVFY